MFQALILRSISWTCSHPSGMLFIFAGSQIWSTHFLFHKSRHWSGSESRNRNSPFQSQSIKPSNPEYIPQQHHAAVRRILISAPEVTAVAADSALTAVLGGASVQPFFSIAHESLNAGQAHQQHNQRLYSSPLQKHYAKFYPLLLCITPLNTSRFISLLYASALRLTVGKCALINERIQFCNHSTPGIWNLFSLFCWESASHNLIG